MGSLEAEAEHVGIAARAKNTSANAQFRHEPSLALRACANNGAAKANNMEHPCVGEVSQNETIDST